MKDISLNMKTKKKNFMTFFPHPKRAQKQKFKKSENKTKILQNESF